MIIANIIFLVLLLLGSGYYYFYVYNVSATGVTAVAVTQLTCPIGTSLLNIGGIANSDGCKCPSGQKYINSKCIATTCPAGMSHTGLGGLVPNYPGCFCPKPETVYVNGVCNPCPVDKPYNSYVGMCVTCSGGSTPFDKGVMASTGCFCPLSMAYINSKCTLCTPIITNSWFKLGTTNWLNSGVQFFDNFLGLSNYSPGGWISQKVENLTIGKKYMILVQCGYLVGQAQPAIRIQVINSDETLLINTAIPWQSIVIALVNGGHIIPVIFTAKEKYHTIKILQDRIDSRQMGFLGIGFVVIASLNTLSNNGCAYPVFINSSFYMPTISQDSLVLTTGLNGWTVTGKLELIRSNVIIPPSGLMQTLCIYGNSSISQTLDYLIPNANYILAINAMSNPTKPPGILSIEPGVATLGISNNSWLCYGFNFIPATSSVTFIFKNIVPDSTYAIMISSITISILN